MVLKRKRSESELSFSSALSSPHRPDANSFDFTVPCSGVSATYRGWFSPSSQSPTPAHLPSRTMKRFRNNRPSEAEVHRRTLNLLYSAQHQQNQQQHPQASHVSQMSQPEGIAPVPMESQQQQNHREAHQRSLHSFWNLPSPVSGRTTSEGAPAPPITLTKPSVLNSCCEDCGIALRGDGDDVMMDVDSYRDVAEDHGCCACGKAVCFSCSVSNLGQHRHCLSCAGRPDPAGGGIGWNTLSGLGVC